ncbi:cuticle protein 38-like [Diprion similis]|uniref:cuticle protein 38-like n=1 Tax=Diprion similis TaxID=362088 RepID=UPI001EF8212C|nr:cuticle protein 38-like [Diprion similis]
MNSFVMMTSFVLLAVLGSGIAGVITPAISAPLVAASPAIGYARAVPYNIPPYASRVDISTRNLAAPYVAAAPVVAAPYVAAPALPYAALPSAPLVAAPGVIPSAYAGSLAAPLAHAYAAQSAAILG